MEKKKIVFLYTEIAAYFLACVEELLKHQHTEVHLIKWEVNKEAPFNFEFSQGLHLYNRKDYNNNELLLLVKKINPDVIYVSGWLDKGYLKVCRELKKSIPVIVGFDNHWKGTIKQRLAVLASPFKILNHFTHCWVPGKPQVSYALRLGFRNEDIITGFYSCDFNFFYSQYLNNKDKKEKKFPRRFIYVGRYIEHKGVRDLWKAFIELQSENPNDWELWCLGIGEINPIVHPQIKHFGFVQPKDMPRFLADTGVFILPSHFEPWGVVVHEFASAGFPLICSNEVGAASAFVENNLNGYIYKSGNISELKEALLKIIKAEQDQLLAMSFESVKKAKLITPEIWSEKLMSVL